MTAPVPIKAALGSWFGAIRTATCKRCDRAFEQQQLSERFMMICEKQGQGAVTAVMRQCPDLWVPVFCPSCERRDLANYGTAEHFAIPIPKRLKDRNRFAENMARLFGAWNRPQDEATSRAYWLALDRCMTDDEFDAAVLTAIRVEKKWPTAATLADFAKNVRALPRGDD